MVSVNSNNPDRASPTGARFLTSRNMQVSDEEHAMVCLWANIDTHWPNETVLNVAVYVGQANEVWKEREEGATDR